MIRLAGVTKLYAGGQAAVRELSIEFPTCLLYTSDAADE